MDKNNKKDHINTGIRSILDNSFIYSFYHYLLGVGYRARVHVNEYIKPFKGAKILDIGCGPAYILEYLPKNIKYTGFDMNPHYIEHAKKKYGHRADFFCTKVAEVSPEHEKKYDIVLATAILHHLNDQDAINLFKIAFNGLKDTGYLITLDNAYIPNQSRISKFLISKDRGQNVRTPEGYLKLARKVFPNVTYEIRNDLFRIPYTHIIYSCSKA